MAARALTLNAGSSSLMFGLSRGRVLVMPTNEEMVIAGAAADLVAAGA